MSGSSRAGWPLWEVFVRSNHGLAHKHVGSLHAADAAMALQNARDVYTRRNEGASLWIVRASDIVASDPADRDALFAASEDKPYRHPTHFAVPEGVKNL
jgi:ring-1,2-phenylacetyl-CoA epoxidase subunit PaaB